jgi:hypothetical protein
VRPDDLHARIVAEEDLERGFVAVRVQPEVTLDRERNDPLDPYATGIAAEDVKLADPAIANVAGEL